MVKLENGTQPEGTRILLRIMKDKELVSMMRPPQVDARGHFLIDGLTAGVYEISASVAGHIGRREVSVQDGIATDVELTIDFNAPPVRSGPPPAIIRP
jgi:hypothetical protein